MAVINHEFWKQQLILEAFVSSKMKIKWTEAADHHCGKGLEQGPPSLEAVAKVRKYFAHKGQQQFVPALEAVVAGGTSTGERWDHGYSCSRCGCLVETAEHRFYECKANSSDLHEDPFVAAVLKSTEYLGKMAKSSLC